MKQSKFLHMSEVPHYKMYKAGKVWLFAAIVGLSLGTATTVSQTSIATAETTAAESSSDATSSTNQTSAALASSSTASNSNQSAASASSSTAPSKVTSTATSSKAQSDTSTAVKTVKNETADNSATSANSASKSDTTNAVSSTTDSTSTSTETKSVTASSIQSGSQQPSASKTDATSLTAAPLIVASSAPKTSDVSSAIPQSETVQSNVQASQTTASTDSAQTKKTDSTSTSTSQSVTQLSAVTPASVTTKAASTANQALTVAPAVKTLQTLGQIDPTKFVKGTKVSISTDGTLIVDLPAGASGDDIQQAKKTIRGAGTKKAQITVNDSVIEDVLNYEQGAETAISGLKFGFWSGAAFTQDGALSDWIGTKTGVPNFDSELSVFQHSASVEEKDAADSQVKTVINDWVSAIVSRLTWKQISSSTAYMYIASNNADLKLSNDTAQQGYLDTIGNFVRGSLTSEAYYLWLVKSRDNTDDSLSYGTQGYNDDTLDSSGNITDRFVSLVKLLNSFSTNVSSDPNLIKAYEAGQATAISWFTGNTDAGLTLEKAIGYNTADSGFNGAVLLDEAGAAARGVVAQKTAPVGLDVIWNTLPGGTAEKSYINQASFITFANVLKVFETDSNFATSVSGSTPSFDNLTTLEKSLAIEVVTAYYDEWQNIVNKAFSQATQDALNGQKIALDYSSSVYSARKSLVPQLYAGTDDQFKIYLFSYQAAKAYLSGFETKNGRDYDFLKYGNGNVPVNSSNVGTSDGVWSPLDLAIYSVLTGKNYTYNTASNGINTEGGTSKPAIVGTDFQSQGYSDTNADWIATAAQNDMYQVAWDTANQAKMDFLSDVQLLINKGETGDLSEESQILPTATNHGMLSDTQYAYYQENSYVYYKVFSILYKSFFLDKQGNPLLDKNGKPTNMVAKALEEADEHVIQSGNAHAGKPIPWDIQTAQSQKDAGLIAGTNGRSFTLNADMTNGVDKDGNIIPYSETDVPATDKDGQATTKPVSTSTLLKNAVDATSTISSDDLGSSITDSSEINNAQKVIQDTVNYAYVHEEAVAIPAYEAGYAAVQKALHPIVKAGESPVGDPTSDTYRYENTSTVTDKLTPVLTTTNPDGSTVWTVHYSNADATNAVITIKRNANPKAPDLGQITSVQIEIDDARTGNQVANDGGSMAAIGQDSSGKVDYTTNLTGANALGNGVLVTYPSMQINNNAKDASKFTKLVVIDNGDGSFSYQFIRDAQSVITTAVAGNQTTKDGTSAGNVYQAGWDYRKSYVSEITLVQRVAKTDYNGVKDTTDNTTNRVVPDQTYAGFFGNGIAGGNQSFLQVKPNAVYGKDYNTVSQTITLLGKSTAAIQIDAAGKLTYTIIDINGKQSASNYTGVMTAGDTVTIDNQETPNDQLKPGYKNSTVVITYAKDGSVNVSETGLQTVMQNSIEVDNDGSATTDMTPTSDPTSTAHATNLNMLVETNNTKTMTATAEVGKGNTTVEPDYISETLVALSDLNHKGVVFSPDTKTGKDGVSSVYNATQKTNTDGLNFQGTTPNPLKADNKTPDDTQAPDAYLGTPLNTTTTVQYVASNVENDKTGVTAVAGYNKSGNAQVVIDLSKAQSTSVSDQTKVDPATNVGSAIFDWDGWYAANAKTLNDNGWTYDTKTQQLTYDPTDPAKQHDLQQQLYGNGFDPNWTSDELGKVTSLKDQYGDLMHLTINKQLANRQTVKQTVNLADVLGNKTQSFTITTADIKTQVQEGNNQGITVDQLKTFANGSDRTFTSTQVDLPDGFDSITVKADGSIVVKLKTDAKAGTVNRALPLSFITDDPQADGDVLNNEDDKKAASSLTLDLNFKSGIAIKYYLEGTTTVVPGSSTLKQSATGSVGDKYSETAPTISGYTLTSDKTVSGTYESTPQNVIFYYKANAVASSVTVNYYVKGTTTKITDSKTLNGNVGGSYTSQAATVTGYTLEATPTNASGTYAASGATVDYYYTVDYKTVPVTPAGTPITGVTPPTGTGTPGEPVSPHGGLPTIPGYTVTKTPNVPDKPGNVNVVYTPQTETVVVNYYLQGTTTPITSSVTLSGPFGSSYQAVPANVAGYTLVATPSNASGTYGVTNDAVNYYYVENVTVVPVDQHGHTLPNVPVKQITGVPGQNIPVSELPQVPGYTPVVTVVTIPGKPAQVEVTYVPVAVPTEKPKPAEPQQPSAPQSVATPIKVAMPETITPQKTAPAVVHAVTKVTQLVQKSQSASETDKLVTLPHTGERDSMLMAIAGISLMVSGFIFIGVRKYRQN